MDSIKNAFPKNTYFAIPSVPCFEYWLLLHFGFQAPTFQDLSNNSAARQMEKLLQKKMPNYEKNQDNLFTQLFEKLEQAEENARRAKTEAGKTNTDNPTTGVHELVKYLRDIKNG